MVTELTNGNLVSLCLNLPLSQLTRNVITVLLEFFVDVVTLPQHSSKVVRTFWVSWVDLDCFSVIVRKIVSCVSHSG